MKAAGVKLLKLDNLQPLFLNDAMGLLQPGLTGDDGGAGQFRPQIFFRHPLQILDGLRQYSLPKPGLLLRIASKQLVIKVLFCFPGGGKQVCPGRQ